MSHKRTEKVCIKTRKVFDWVTRQVDLPLISKSGSDLNHFFICHGHDHDDISQFLDEHKHSGPFTVTCDVIDDSVTCEEIPQPGGRLDVTVTLPNGDEVTLQKVKVIVKGKVNVDILDGNDNVICRSKYPIPFVTAQTFILCAPEGTDIDCEVTFDECDAVLMVSHDMKQLDISITLCLDVQVEADVKLEVEARFCKPRDEDIAGIDICPAPKFPPQCPEIFPAH
ncbi:hypothetical protein [Bacillus sp. FJAT-47783]|uniref:hypothetical protein n=1 Tax=Bacillus sp. FJAT-47783 TaxID=2922712 RepID=UPI001FADBA7A